MKTFRFFQSCAAIFGLFFIAQSSSAYVQYTYESDALEWQYTILNGAEYEEINSDPDGKINFNFSFSIDESLLSATAPTSFIVKNADVFTDTATGNEYYERDLHSLFYGKIVINPDTTIKFWNFVIATEVRDLNESNYLNRLRDHDVRIISAGGATTCNCDRFWEDINLTIQRPYNTWAIAATLDNHYRSNSDFDNWTITPISVPESSSFVLLGISLVVLMLTRRKIKQ